MFSIHVKTFLTSTSSGMETFLLAGWRDEAKKKKAGSGMDKAYFRPSPLSLVMD